MWQNVCTTAEKKRTNRSVAARAGMLVVNVTNMINAKMKRNIDRS